MAKPAAPAPAVPAAPPAPAAPATSTAPAALMSFEIEDNIPIPERRVGVRSETAYPFLKLAVGQAFFVASSDKMKEPWKTLTSLASRVSRENYPVQFTSSRATKGDVEGVRIWRIEDRTGPMPEKKTRRKRSEMNAAAQANDTTMTAVAEVAPPPPPAA